MARAVVVMNVDTALRQAGLGNNEAKVYVAGLKLGEATAAGLARESGLQRSIIYRYAESLAAKGLVRRVLKNGVTRFECAHPQQLSSLVAEKLQAIEEAIPALSSLRDNAAAPSLSLSLIDGWDGVRLMFNESLKLKRGQEICVTAFNLGYMPAFGDYFNKLNRLRDKKGVKARFIYGDSPQARERLKFHKELKRGLFY